MILIIIRIIRNTSQSSPYCSTLWRMHGKCMVSAERVHVSVWRKQSECMARVWRERGESVARTGQGRGEGKASARQVHTPSSTPRAVHPEAGVATVFTCTGGSARRASNIGLETAFKSIRLRCNKVVITARAPADRRGSYTRPESNKYLQHVRQAHDT